MLNEIEECEYYLEQFKAIKDKNSTADTRMKLAANLEKYRYERVLGTLARYWWFSDEIKRIGDTAQRIEAVKVKFQEVCSDEQYNEHKHDSLERTDNRYTMYSLIADAANAGPLVGSEELREFAVLRKSELIYLLRFFQKLKITNGKDFQKNTTLTKMIALLIIYYRAYVARFGTHDDFLRLQLDAFRRWFSFSSLRADRRKAWKSEADINALLIFDYRDEQKAVMKTTPSTPFYKIDLDMLGAFVEEMRGDEVYIELHVEDETYVFTDNDVIARLEGYIKSLDKSISNWIKHI